MDLPTYTNIWRIEKRLYKLYDFRLPMPLPVGQIAVFTAIAVPYVVILKVAGLPFSHTLLWLYILPPGALAWVVTRPVLESKRLPELVVSQLRYLSEPRTWCRMAPLAEKDEIVITARVWRRAGGEKEAVGQPVVLAAGAAGAATAEAAPTAPAPPSPEAPVRPRRAARVRRPAAAVPAPAPRQPPVPPVGKAPISEPEGRSAAWGEERRWRRATREGGASEAPRRRAGEHSEPEGQRAPRRRAGDAAAPAWPDQPARGVRVPVACDVRDPAGAALGARIPVARDGPDPAEAARVTRVPAASDVPDQGGASPAAAARPVPDVPAPVRAAAASDVSGPPAAEQQSRGVPPGRVGRGVRIPGDQAARAVPAPDQPGDVSSAPGQPARAGAAPEQAAAAVAGRGQAAAVSAPGQAAAAVPGPGQAAAAVPGPGQAAAAAPAPDQAGAVPAPDRAVWASGVPPTAPAAAAAPPPPAPPPRPRPVVRVTGDQDAERPLPVVERALGGPSGRRGSGWHDHVVVVPGGHRPGRPDQMQRDRARARLPVPGAHRVVVLGCTVGAGQTMTALLLGELLASLRGDEIAVLDLNPGPGSLAERARAVPALTGSQPAAPSRAEVITLEAALSPPAPQASAPAGAGSSGHAADLEDVTRVFELVSARYPLTLADPGAAAVPRVLAVADQLILVTPASQDAASALATTREWLEAHGHSELADQAIVVLNGVSRHTIAHVEQAEALARGRCRAIVRIPWDDRLKHPRSAVRPSGGPLTPAALHAYTALSGVLIAALAAAPQRLRVRP